MTFDRMFDISNLVANNPVLKTEVWRTHGRWIAQVQALAQAQNAPASKRRNCL